MDHLLTFAQLSIVLAGFASVFIAFRDKELSSWNQHIFVGLIGHAVTAFLFCMIPFVINVFTEDLALIWAICSFLLGGANLTGICYIIATDRKSSLRLLIYSSITALGSVAILFLNAFNIFFHQAEAAYLVGLIWHLTQGVLIFAILTVQTQKFANDVRNEITPKESVSKNETIRTEKDSQA